MAYPIIRSTVRPSFLRKVLQRGTCIALLGVGCLLAGGLFLPADLLNLWGLPLWTLGVGLIGAGLIPYRRLKQLELHPFELHLEEEDTLYLIRKGQVLAHLHLYDVSEWEYVENEQTYGIRVHFRNEKTSLWLPYFSKSAYEKLKNERNR